MTKTKVNNMAKIYPLISQMYDHNKTKQHLLVSIFYGIYCIFVAFQITFPQRLLTIIWAIITDRSISIITGIAFDNL